MTVKITVRQDGKVLWKKHPTADVGILPITPPPDALVPSVSVDLLASDEDLERHQIHPGDPVRRRRLSPPQPTSSSPMRQASASSGSGCIAGYPLRPTRKTKTLLLDLNTFEGDSGAPVYLVDDHRLAAGKTNLARCG